MSLTGSTQAGCIHETTQISQPLYLHNLITSSVIMFILSTSETAECLQHVQFSCAFSMAYPLQESGIACLLSADIFTCDLVP